MACARAEVAGCSRTSRRLPNATCDLTQRDLSAAAAATRVIRNRMKQTPPHDQHNPDLLRLMPRDLKRVVEVGCSRGALARAYAGLNPECEYVGIEIDPEFAAHAHAFCTSVICGDIEQLGDAAF